MQRALKAKGAPAGEKGAREQPAGEQPKSSPGKWSSKKQSSRQQSSSRGDCKGACEGDPFPDIAELYRRLQRRFGPLRCPLHYQAPHELAIAVILSAQCTDEQVNRVTPALFRAFPTPQDFYQRPPEELERLIYSTGFYRSKAGSIRQFCRMLVERFGGKIPDSMEQLLSMPGVGRKTANVILQELYQKSEGIVVDTHVARISRLLALTQAKDPKHIENDLIGKIPRSYWLQWSLLLIFLGRSSCTARKRNCLECPLGDICPSSSVAGGGSRDESAPI